jgi:hypothetical protein
MSELLKTLMSNANEFLPFACLITGKIPARKMMITRLIESLIVGIVGGAFSLVIGFKMMEKDIERLKEVDAVHQQWAVEHVQKRDAELSQDRAAMFVALGRVESRLASLEDCIRVRTCTK